MPPTVDIVSDILKAVLEVQPGSVFVNSLYQQYCNRGGLSKKQLEGLHSKASKIETISSGKLATLEAIIKKKPTRYRSVATVIPEQRPKDESAVILLTAILKKYPGHKRVLFLQSRLAQEGSLTPAEIKEVERFYGLLIK